jgi:hypothetical protein
MSNPRTLLTQNNHAPDKLVKNTAEVQEVHCHMRVTLEKMASQSSESGSQLLRSNAISKKSQSVMTAFWQTKIDSFLLAFRFNLLRLGFLSCCAQRNFLQRPRLQKTLKKHAAAHRFVNHRHYQPELMSAARPNFVLPAKQWVTVRSNEPCELCWRALADEVRATCEPPCGKTHYHCLAEECTYHCNDKQRALSHSAVHHVLSTVGTGQKRPAWEGRHLAGRGTQLTHSTKMARAVNDSPGGGGKVSLPQL